MDKKLGVLLYFGVGFKNHVWVGSKNTENNFSLWSWSEVKSDYNQGPDLFFGMEDVPHDKKAFF